MKRTLSLLLALLTVGSMLASCSNNDTSSDAKSSDDTVSASDTVSGETAEQSETPNLPDKKFNGEDFLFLTSGDADVNGVDWATYDIYVESETGDVIDDAVYSRNSYIADTYNIFIKEKRSDGKTEDEARKVILASEHVYDAIVSNLTSCAKLAQDGHTYNLYDIPYIDLEKSWWDGNLVKNLSVAGRINFATGDITVIDNDAVWVLMFNKRMVEDYDLPNLYETVLTDEWYFDTFAEMLRSVSADLNGDGKMVGLEDQFGMTTGKYTGLAAYYTSGISLVSKDKDDLPVYSLDTDRAQSIAEKWASVMIPDLSFNYATVVSEHRKTFEDGRALFFGEVLQCVIRMRASETDFGVIPYPKFDESQDDFHHVAIPTASKAVAVPITQVDTDKAGIVLEAMAYKSQSTLTPAYYDYALSRKYMRDEQSTEMLDIILSTLSLDLAYVYNWADMTTTIRDIVFGDPGTLVSSVDSSIDKFNAELDNTILFYIEKNSD